MSARLPEGYTFSAEYDVTRDLCTEHIPGLPPIMGSPSMIYLIEATGYSAMAPYLEAGESTVGLGIYVNHLAPTPVGDKIKVALKLLKQDGRLVEWGVEVTDSKDIVSQGRHERYFIEIDRFKSIVAKKLDRPTESSS